VSLLGEVAVVRACGLELPVPLVWPAAPACGARARPASERQPANINVHIIGAVDPDLIVLNRGEEPEALVYYKVNTPSFPVSILWNMAGARVFRFCRREYTDLDRFGKWN
jgi:hypothetical protein